MGFDSAMRVEERNSVTQLRKCCQQARERGVTVFDLSMINPDLSPAREVLDRFIEASLKPNTHRYTAARGLRKLREAFAHKYDAQFGVQIDAQTEVCVTLGAKDATLQLLGVLSKVADTLLLPSPTYPAMVSAADIIGGYASYYYDASTRDVLVESVLSLMEAHPGAVVLLNSPNNPTGMTLEKASLQQLVDGADRYGCYLCNDFVYGEMGFAHAPESLLSASHESKGFHRIVEIYSLSKAYAIPGWRIAGVIGDQHLVGAIADRKSQTDYGTFTPLQIGAAAALRASPAVVRETAGRYADRSQVVCEGLEEMGCQVVSPEAGASVWAKLPDWFPGDADFFAMRMIEQTGVVLLPGRVFGDGYERWFRIALVQPKSVLRECLARIGEAMRFIRQRDDRQQAPG